MKDIKYNRYAGDQIYRSEQRAQVQIRKMINKGNTQYKQDDGKSLKNHIESKIALNQRKSITLYGSPSGLEYIHHKPSKQERAQYRKFQYPHSCMQCFTSFDCINSLKYHMEEVHGEVMKTG
mmetsp:Transcript_11406/g.19245  ORF Transcript_11406/g.19245 Transcript_11406/m.19245 type:complete len:122 (+) Transcript_11406:50-415(+)